MMLWSDNEHETISTATGSCWCFYRRYYAAETTGTTADEYPYTAREPKAKMRGYITDLKGE